MKNYCKICRIGEPPLIEALKWGGIAKFDKVRIAVVFLLITIVMATVNLNSTDVYAQNDISYDDSFLEEVATGIIDWKTKSEGKEISENLIEDVLSTAAGSPAADWYAVAVGMLYPENEFPVYLNKLYDFVNQEYKKGIQANASPIDFHRIIIAINSLGGDASKVPLKDSDGSINLISDFVYDRENLNMLINTLSFGLMALDSRNYDTPEDSVFDRRGIIEEIINLKIPSKGFSLSGNITDPDITAMVIQALAPYYDDEIKYAFNNPDAHGVQEITVKEVIDQSLEILSAMQLESGDFKSWGNRNSQTGAQVIIALCRLGINPLEDERFIINGVSLSDGLINYRQENGGFANLSDSGRSDSKASEQALLAFTAMLISDRYDSVIYTFEDSSDEILTPTGENTPEPRTSSESTSDSEADSEDNVKNSNRIMLSTIIFYGVLAAAVIAVIAVIIFYISKR